MERARAAEEPGLIERLIEAAGSGAVADPVGFIEVTDDGAVFREIGRPVAKPLLLLLLSAAAGMSLVLRALARLLR